MLIALAWPSHVHHHRAQAWFAGNASGGWATCPLTQCAFVRISSNPKVIPEAGAPKEAIALLDQVVKQANHNFWHDDITLLDDHVPGDLLVGHRQVTDVYLLGLAIRHGGRLVTLDKATSSLLSSHSPDQDALHIVPA
jgi:hypothetical protein